jgi:hypothetical protein
VSFEEEEKVMRRSRLDISYGNEHGGDSLRGVYRDTILLPMSRMATNQLRLLETRTAYLGILLEELNIEDSFWIR